MLQIIIIIIIIITIIIKTIITTMIIGVLFPFSILVCVDHRLWSA